MKDPINLLPLPTKTSRMRILYVVRAQRVLNLLVFVLAVAVVFLLIMWGGLVWLQRRMQADSVVKGAHIADSSQAVVATNAFLNAFHEQVGHSVLWTDKMTDLLTALPDGLQLSSVSVATTAKPPTVTTLTAEGVTVDPTLVVAWRKKIEQLPWVASVTAPLDNFATDQHGSFVVTVIIATPSPTPL
jgi:hypothetical protein